MAEEPQTTQASTSENSSHESLKQTQVPAFSGFVAAPPNGDIQLLPIMYPALVPAFFPLQQAQEQINNGAGLYAVPILPFMGPIAGYHPNTLIPLTYRLPTGPSPPQTGAVGEGQVGEGQEQVGQQQQPQQPAPQRRVVRRFQIQFQIDLLLILKLAAVIFLFNHDGSRQRLLVLVFFASLVYLYQTGALAPLIRWLSQGMQREAAPPQQPRPAVRAENAPAAAALQGNENAPVAGAENVNQRENGEVENEALLEAGAGNGGNRWWGIIKEMQMFVFGFITSLFPGFHNID